MNANLARIACLMLAAMPMAIDARDARVAQATHRQSDVKASGPDVTAERRFVLPSRTIGLVIPRADWVVEFQQRNPSNTAHYYVLSSATYKIPFSFYIDRSTACPSAKICLDAALKNPAYIGAKDLTKSEVGPFAVAQFYIESPVDPKLSQANVLASAFVDGQWFDIHLSSVDEARPDMAPLMKLLRQIEIR